MVPPGLCVCCECLLTVHVNCPQLLVTTSRQSPSPSAATPLLAGLASLSALSLSVSCLFFAAPLLLHTSNQRRPAGVLTSSWVCLWFALHCACAAFACRLSRLVFLSSLTSHPTPRFAHTPFTSTLYLVPVLFLSPLLLISSLCSLPPLPTSCFLFHPIHLLTPTSSTLPPTKHFHHQYQQPCSTYFDHQISHLSGHLPTLLALA